MEELTHRNAVAKQADELAQAESARGEDTDRHRRASKGYEKRRGAHPQRVQKVQREWANSVGVNKAQDAWELTLQRTELAVVSRHGKQPSTRSRRSGQPSKQRALLRHREQAHAGAMAALNERATDLEKTNARLHKQLRREKTERRNVVAKVHSTRSERLALGEVLDVQSREASSASEMCPICHRHVLASAMVQHSHRCLFAALSAATEYADSSGNA